MKGVIYLAPEGTDPNDPKVWGEISCAEVTGYSVGPVSVDPGSDWDTPVKVEPVYRRMAYASGRGWGKRLRQERLLQENLEREAKVMRWADEHHLLTPWQRSFLNGLLGNWQETPREELRRRLNNRLRGTDPGAPINWKGLK